MRHGGGCWAPIFSRSFNNWELDEVASFLSQIVEESY